MTPPFPHCYVTSMNTMTDTHGWNLNDIIIYFHIVTSLHYHNIALKLVRIQYFKVRTCCFAYNVKIERKLNCTFNFHVPVSQRKATMATTMKCIIYYCGVTASSMKCHRDRSHALPIERNQIVDKILLSIWEQSCYGVCITSRKQESTCIKDTIFISRGEQSCLGIRIPSRKQESC